MKRNDETPMVKTATQPIPCWLVGLAMRNYKNNFFFSELNQEIFGIGEEAIKETDIREELDDILSKEYQVDFETLSILSSFSDINLSKKEYNLTIDEIISESQEEVREIVWVRCEIPTGADYAKLDNGVFISNRLNIIGVLEIKENPGFIEDVTPGENEEKPGDSDLHLVTPDPIPSPRPIQELKMEVPEGWKVGEIRQEGTQLVIPIAPVGEIVDFDELTLQMEQEKEMYLPDSEYGRKETAKIDALQQLVRTAAYLNYQYPKKREEKRVEYVVGGKGRQDEGYGDCVIALTEGFFSNEVLKIIPAPINPSDCSVYFNTPELAKKAIQILGEETVKTALRPIQYTGK